MCLRTTQFASIQAYSKNLPHYKSVGSNRNLIVKMQESKWRKRVLCFTLTLLNQSSSLRTMTDAVCTLNYLCTKSSGNPRVNFNKVFVFLNNKKRCDFFSKSLSNSSGQQYTQKWFFAAGFPVCDTPPAVTLALATLKQGCIYVTLLEMQKPLRDLTVSSLFTKCDLSLLSYSPNFVLAQLEISISYYQLQQIDMILTQLKGQECT